MAYLTLKSMNEGVKPLTQSMNFFAKYVESKPILGELNLRFSNGPFHLNVSKTVGHSICHVCKMWCLGASNSSGITAHDMVGRLVEAASHAEDKGNVKSVLWTTYQSLSPENLQLLDEGKTQEEIVWPFQCLEHESWLNEG
jgi:hypothetical protein